MPFGHSAFCTRRETEIAGPVGAVLWNAEVKLKNTFHDAATESRPIRFTIHNYHPSPYASAEFLYQSQYSKWSSTRLYVACCR
jgi:hypothetical protein